MKKQTGMTLIELMVATIILAIMVGVAVPAMKSQLDAGNFSVIGPIFEKSVKLARTEAIQSSQNVRITPNSNTNDWTQGWSIELITGPNPADFQLIRTIDAMPGDATFTSDTFDGDTPILIRPNGQTSLIGSFTLQKRNCLGEIFTYNLLLSGIVDRRSSACP